MVDSFNYKKLLKDNRWKKRSAEIKLRDNFECQMCGTSSLPLNVHHLKYVYGLLPWEYGDEFLITICSPCHESNHDIFSNIEYSPCVCSKCKTPITNKNCSTIGKLGDYYRNKVFCDPCNKELNNG